MPMRYFSDRDLDVLCAILRYVVVTSPNTEVGERAAKFVEELAGELATQPKGLNTPTPNRSLE